MTRVSALLLALLVQAALIATASAAPAIPFSADTTPRDYIVAFKSSANANSETTGLERKFGFASKFRYGAALKGFAARLTPSVAAAVARLPFVDAVEIDGIASIDADALAGGENAPTGIRRMGGATTTAAHSAASVAVAVIDTGIDLSHPDLNAVNGTNCISARAQAHRRPRPRHARRRHDRCQQQRQPAWSGVAPGTQVYAVKVLNSPARAAVADHLRHRLGRHQRRGAQHQGREHEPRRRRHRPIGMRTAEPRRSATQRAGVTFVVAAGNNGANLSNYSPANYPEVLTVTAVADSDGQGGATGGSPSCWSGQPDDQVASFTNYATSTSTSREPHDRGPGRVHLLDRARRRLRHDVRHEHGLAARRGRRGALPERRRVQRPEPGADHPDDAQDRREQAR